MASWTDEQRDRAYKRWTPEARRAHGEIMRKSARDRAERRQRRVANPGCDGPVLFTRQQLSELCTDLEEKMRIGRAAEHALRYFSAELARLDAGAECQPLRNWSTDPLNEAGDVPLA